MDPITIALALATQFAPAAIKYLTKSDTAGAVASQVIDIAKTVTGKGDPTELAPALAADPALQLQFQQAVMAHDITLSTLAYADTANARARDVEFIHAGRVNYRADLLALLAVGGLVLCVYFIASDAGLPERAVNAIMFVAGVLASAVRDVYGFEFGSSRSSRDKDETISNLSK